MAVFLIVLFFLMPTTTVSSEPLGRFCSGIIDDNSNANANLKLLSNTFAEKASSAMYAASAEFLFAKGSVGSGLQTMYGLALCRGDTANASACSDCIIGAFGNAQQLCASNKDAAVIDDMCLIRFSYEDFIDKNDFQEITYGVVNTMNTTMTINTSKPRLLPGWDPGNPAARITAVIKKLLLDTCRTAAYNMRRRYVTGFMDATSTMPQLYSMAQCTPDLTPGDCMTCLQYVADAAMTSFIGQQAGQILSLRCSLRYDMDPFYRGEPIWRVPPPDYEPIWRVPPPDNVLPEPPGAATKSKGEKWLSRHLVIALTVPLLATFFGLIILIGFIRRHRKGKVSEHKVKIKAKEDEELVWGLEGKDSEFKIYDFAQVVEGTGNFSERNKLGKGGFGPVYKGKFPDGLEIAVKRLASRSVQGFTEFKNEIQLIAKLQHTNLVRLLGCCSLGEEKILIYEYLPNKSLDFFIFDPVRKYIINWTKRLAIIQGVAEGLLYLHKHSRLRVIHRDLKASNILLDCKMNPKISDFGLAKIFNTNQAEGNTSRIAGTFGYMAPEYASEGIFSTKSDVFSYGVLILEVVSGKRTSSLHGYGDFINLLGHSWQLWRDGLWLQLVDASIDVECHTLEVRRCMNIALLCVQENAADRPTMSDVVQMLSSESLILPEPKHPAYFHVRVSNEEASTVVVPSSVNDVTVSALVGR